MIESIISAIYSDDFVGGNYNAHACKYTRRGSCNACMLDLMFSGFFWDFAHDIDSIRAYFPSAWEE